MNERYGDLTLPDSLADRPARMPWPGQSEIGRLAAALEGVRARPGDGRGRAGRAGLAGRRPAAAPAPGRVRAAGGARAHVEGPPRVVDAAGAPVPRGKPPEPAA
jgi:hypothetical protein